MYMQGAQFDTDIMKIEESVPRVLFSLMPVIQLKPVIATELDRSGTYKCPLYKTSRRAGTLSTTGHSTDFVVPLDIPTEKPSGHWVRRGGNAVYARLLISIGCSFIEICNSSKILTLKYIDYA